MAANNLYFPQIDRTYTIVPENYIAIDNKQTGLPYKINITDFVSELKRLEFIPDTFLELTDTPDTYTGSENFLVTVNGAGDALVFTDIADLITDTNFANTPLTFTVDRAHDLATKKLTFNNVDKFIINRGTANTGANATLELNSVTNGFKSTITTNSYFALWGIGVGGGSGLLAETDDAFGTGAVIRNTNNGLALSVSGRVEFVTPLGLAMEITNNNKVRLTSANGTKYADDAAAGVGGVTVGEVYVASGANPSYPLGTLVVKQ